MEKLRDKIEQHFTLVLGIVIMSNIIMVLIEPRSSLPNEGIVYWSYNGILLGLYPFVISMIQFNNYRIFNRFTNAVSWLAVVAFVIFGIQYAICDFALSSGCEKEDISPEVFDIYSKEGISYVVFSTVVTLQISIILTHLFIKFQNWYNIKNFAGYR